MTSPTNDQINPFFDPEVIKKAVYPDWYNLFLWVFPTYVSFGEEVVIFWKKIGDTIFVVGEEKAPWMK